MSDDLLTLLPNLATSLIVGDAPEQAEARSPVLHACGGETWLFLHHRRLGGGTIVGLGGGGQYHHRPFAQRN